MRFKVDPLLFAARYLAGAGRAKSATVLRSGLDDERLLFSIAGANRKAPRSGTALSSEIRVAAVLDEFSANGFSGACRIENIHPDTWRDRIKQIDPSVFFCESAWSGADSEKRPWKGRVYASKNFPKENRGILLDIIAFCRKEGIPTVFWNKEDPTHYEDRVHDFVKTASEFEHVFTTADECVPLYKSEYGLKSVHTLPFGTNPSLFNPIENATRVNSVTFAGSWYANHVQRSNDMRDIMSGILRAGYSLEIYDRYYGGSDKLHEWPEEYSTYLKPSIPHDRVAEVYKRSKLSLNINTVTNSRTMFARRVFELMSSNTAVISNYSKGMEEFFGDDVIFCGRDISRLRDLNPEEIDAIRDRNLQLVLSKHTYRARWEQILETIGVRFASASETLTVVWPVSSEADANAGIEWFQREAAANSDQLLLLVTDQAAPLDVAALYERFNRFGITVSSVRHAEDLAIHDRYAPIENEYLALVHSADMPPAGWLMRARAHLQYIGQSAAIVRAEDSRYRLSEGSLVRRTFLRKRPVAIVDNLLSDKAALYPV